MQRVTVPAMRPAVNDVGLTLQSRQRTRERSAGCHYHFQGVHLPAVYRRNKKWSAVGPSKGGSLRRAGCPRPLRDAIAICGGRQRHLQPLQWPTILTALMFPLLALMYARLASNEEREVEGQFGKVWLKYTEDIPRWFPRLRARPHAPTANRH
jgi:hypothetical protein